MAKVIINPERCKGCGLCANVCPLKILRLSSDAMNSKGYYPAECFAPEKCIGCASCAKMCPDSVIEVER